MASLSLPQLALCSYLKQSHSHTHNHTTSAKRLELGAHLGPDPHFLSKQESKFPLRHRGRAKLSLCSRKVVKKWNATKVIRWTCVERHQISSIKHHMLRCLAAWVSSVLLSTSVSCLCPEATWRAVFCISCWQKWEQNKCDKRINSKKTNIKQTSVPVSVKI